MARLSKKMMYALEAVVDIAYNAGANPVQSQDITARQKIPKRYLEQMMQKLVRAGVLKGVRGPKGGYYLARERRRITVGDIARVINNGGEEDPLKGVPCSNIADKVIRPLWRKIDANAMEQLDQITVEDLCRRAHAKGVECQIGEGAYFDI